MKEEDILYEQGNFFVLKAEKGYEVCHNAHNTHSVVVAFIGEHQSLGLPRAVAECNRRASV